MLKSNRLSGSGKTYVNSLILIAGIVLLANVLSLAVSNDHFSFSNLVKYLERCI